MAARKEKPGQNEKPSRKEAPAEQPKLMKTREVLARSGITRPMLYLYQTMGLIDAVKTTPAGHRLYGEDVLRKLKIVRAAVETGYSLRDVREIFFVPSRRKREKHEG
jgi:DNA-binding transcriptional MerR regulator